MEKNMKKDIYIYICKMESLCCIPEINMLQINYTSIKKKNRLPLTLPFILSLTPFTYPPLTPPFTNWSLTLPPTHSSSPMSGTQSCHEIPSGQLWLPLTMKPTQPLTSEGKASLMPVAGLHTSQTHKLEPCCLFSSVLVWWLSSLRALAFLYVQ